MKIRKLTILCLVFLSLFSNLIFSQSSDLDRLKDKVKKDFKTWLVKGEFETDADYEIRIKNQAATKFNNLIIKEIEKSKTYFLKTKYAKMGKYNIENETFQLICGISDTMIVPVNKNIAADFSKIGNRTGGFDKPTIYVIPNNIEMINNSWSITKAVILFDNFWSGADFTRNQTFKLIKEADKYFYEYDNYGIKKYLILDLKKLVNPTDISKEVYFYEWQSAKNNEIQTINFNYYDLDVTLPEFK